MRESVIEQQVCDYAEIEYNYLPIKLTSDKSRNGLPDRLFVGKTRTIFFIEFKATGEEPSKLQLYYIKLLRTLGFKVYVVDSIEQGKKIIDKEEKARRWKEHCIKETEEKKNSNKVYY